MGERVKPLEEEGRPQSYAQPRDYGPRRDGCARLTGHLKLTYVLSQNMSLDIGAYIIPTPCKHRWVDQRDHVNGGVFQHGAKRSTNYETFSESIKRAVSHAMFVSKAAR